MSSHELSERPAAPLVSVVVPAYNPESFLLETIASAESQTHPNCEVVVVDDGSNKPESLELLERVTDRVRLVRQANKGLAGARNAGIRNARGEFVVPLDADDLLEPQMVEQCLAAQHRRPENGFVYFDYTVFGDSHYVEKPGEYNLYRLLNENFMACCCFFPSPLAVRVGGLCSCRCLACRLFAIAFGLWVRSFCNVVQLLWPPRLSPQCLLLLANSMHETRRFGSPCTLGCLFT